MIARGLAQRIKFQSDPALSFVPRLRAAERLLADDGTGRLVVDVEVPRCVAELVMRVEDGGAIAGEDRTRQRVR